MGSVRAWAVTCGLLVLLIQPTIAGRLPDWCQAIADGMPPLPDGLPTHLSRNHVTETRISVRSNGDLIVGKRVASRALSASIPDFALESFVFDEQTHFTRSKAWHLPPSGKARKSKRAETFDLTYSDAFLTDGKARMIYVGEIEKGSLVCFDFEAVVVPDQLVHHWWVYEDAPTDVSRFLVELPDGWNIRHSWLRSVGPDPLVDGNDWRWEASNLQPGEDEPLGVSAIDTAPLLVVAFVPPEGQEVNPGAMPSWLSLASWYEALAREQDRVTPEISERGAAVLDATEVDFFTEVEVLGRYVRDSVRYVAKEIGIGGYRPSPAEEVLRRLWGDCKDKGTLYRALLSSAGHVSYPVLINATDEETVSDELPSLRAFNHFVVAIPVPPGTSVPDSFASAVADGGPLGPLVIVDTTDEYSTIGTISSALEGKTGLVVAGERSALVRLPSGDPATHRVERRLEAEIGNDGTIAIEMRTTCYGEPAARHRRDYSLSIRDYRVASEEALREEWPGATIEHIEVAPETEAGAFVEQVRLTVPGRDEPGSTGLVRVFPGAIHSLPRAPLSRRKTPVRYAYARTLHYESTIHGVPAGAAVPDDRKTGGDGWSVEASFSREGLQVRGTWTVVLERTRFDPESFGELAEFWTAARRAAHCDLASEAHTPRPYRTGFSIR